MCDPATASYDANNRLTWTSVGSLTSGPGYSASGNSLSNGQQSFTYDQEGRICAVYDTSYGSTTKYLYDADGNRVAKGVGGDHTNCSRTGVSWTKQYVLGQGGEDVTEIDGSGNWTYSNAYAGGRLLATYKGSLVYFGLNDWLGTKRVEANADGKVCSSYQGYPYGQTAAPNITGECPGADPDPSELHFTGKLHDDESGLDYFGARYYSSYLGRWMSPDWSAKAEPVPYSKLDDPQTLNLYGYVRSNPLGQIDPDGHCPLCVEVLQYVADSPVRQEAEKDAQPIISAIGAGAAAVGTFIATHANEIASSYQDAVAQGAGATTAIYVGPVANQEGTSVFSKAGDGAGKSGPKAATAPGVTVGGQATDEHGNKLGSSGKPQVNETESNTREGARNKALKEGSGATEHSNPTRGKPHFHPTDSEGNKKPTSTHHNYPDD